MRVRIYAMGRGVYLFTEVVTLWSDGDTLRIQHHQDKITTLPMRQVREIERIDPQDDVNPIMLGWTDRQLQKVA